MAIYMVDNFNVTDSLSHLIFLSSQHALLAPHWDIDMQPTVRFLFTYFFMACSHNQAAITMQICSSINVVFQTPCDLVAPRLGPMIWAKFLFLLCHRPMHDGSLLLHRRVS